MVQIKIHICLFRDNFAIVDFSHIVQAKGIFLWVPMDLSEITEKYYSTFPQVKGVELKGASQSTEQIKDAQKYRLLRPER